VVGEARDAGLVSAAVATGRTVCGVEPRGAVVWETLSDCGRPASTMVLAEVGEHLASMAGSSAAGLALAGCVDRIGLAAKAALVRNALRVTVAGGRVVLLVTDQDLWDQELDAPARDLLPGRPLHPETWSLLLRRSGADSVTWHRPTGSGAIHAVVVDVGQ
jgi:hypothetical protein